MLDNLNGAVWCVCLLFWVPWYVWFVKWPFPLYVLVVSGILCNFCWNLFAIFRCDVEGLRVASILLLLSILPLYCSVFLPSVDLLLLEFGGWYCWLLQLNLSFSMSGISLSKVGSNLSYSNCIGSIWILYLLPICIALVLTCVISSSYAFLMLAQSAKLMPPTQLLSTILNLPKYSVSASLFWVWYVWCDISSVSAGAICVRLLHFSVTFNCQKILELIDMLGLLLFRLNRISLSL